MCDAANEGDGRPMPRPPLDWTGVVRPGMNERLVLEDGHGVAWFVSFERATELGLFDLPAVDPAARDRLRHRSEQAALTHARYRSEGIDPGPAPLQLERAIQFGDGSILIPPRVSNASS